MTDCMLATTGARNLAIGAMVLFLRVLCMAGMHLMGAVQSLAGSTGEVGVAHLKEGATDTAEAANRPSMPSRWRRNRPLCNECSFAVGHGHAERIGARRTGSEVLP